MNLEWNLMEKAGDIEPLGSVGADLGATLTTDYAGVARPQNSVFDLGAYEYIVSAGGGSGGMSETPAWSSPRRSPLWRR